MTVSTTLSLTPLWPFRPLILHLRFILAIHAYDGHLKWEKRRI